MTPVFYSIEILPKTLQTIFKFNPMYQFLTTTREIVLFGNNPGLMNLGILGLISVVTLLIGGIVFKKNQDKFIYYV